MQDKELKEGFVLLAVPMEVIAEAGITEGQVLEFTTEEGKMTVAVVDPTDDFACDGDCESCPVHETECDGNCENCPCYKNCGEE